MIDLFYEAYFKLYEIFSYTQYEGGVLTAALKFIPFVLFFELPFAALLMLGITRYWLRSHFGRSAKDRPYYPGVTCIVTCYAEGHTARQALYALAQQRYPGNIEIIALVDGATRNSETWLIVQGMKESIDRTPNRTLIPAPKWQRGGRVSSTNSGLALARNEIIVSLDGDTVLDNDAIYRLTRHFARPGVVGVACSLRVLNADENLLTAFQAVEYMMSIKATRTGLAEFGVVNNISGAFGAFRRDFIRHIGGWDTGTAEDLNITTRIKAYFGRYPGTRLEFEPHAVGLTEAPSTVMGFFKQRLRWDGDLFYIYIRKFWRSFTPRIFGWPNLLLYCWTGLLFQLLMPFAIMAYTIFLFMTLPAPVVLGVMGLIYLFYLLLTGLFYGQYLLMLSERPWTDLKYTPLLLIYPFFAFFGRCWNGVATIVEMAMKSHRDTSMAPWWVLRRSRF